MLICAGGTGGGVYPALAVLEALKRRLPAALEVLWVGGEGGMEEELVKREGISYRSIPAAGVHGVGWRALPGSLAKLARGFAEARRIVRGFKPDALFFTGGYVAAPIALAGHRIPAALYAPDIEPGLALKFLARFAAVITATASESAKYFPRSKRLIATGYPLRSALSAWSREKGIRYFGLDSAAPILLVTGGSKGARSINMAVLKHLNELLETAQVIHISGALDWSEVEANKQTLPARLLPRYRAMPYLHEMGAALAAADLALSRAGASTLGEYPFFGLPAVLAPYPYAWRYQKVNADYLAQRNAAVILPDDLLDTELPFVIKDILMNKGKLENMRAAMRGLSQPDAADRIAGQLLELAGVKRL